jgi:hypothetical protein
MVNFPKSNYYFRLIKEKTEFYGRIKRATGGESRNIQETGVQILGRE